MGERRQDAVNHAYLELHSELCRVFYEEDPEGFGISVGTPDDEYSQEMTRLIVHLKTTSTRDEVADVVRREYPNATRWLVKRTWTAWQRFRHDLQL